MNIWNLNDSAPISGTLPVVPNIPNTVDLLAQLHQVESSVVTVSGCMQELAQERASNLDQLSSSKGQVASNCNRLAACTLTAIKSSPNCTYAQELTVEIQQLSHAIAKADKAINYLLKNNRHFVSGKKVSIRPTPGELSAEELPGAGAIDVSLPIAAGNEHGCTHEQEVASVNVAMTNIAFPDQVESSATLSARHLDCPDDDDSTLI